MGDSHMGLQARLMSQALRKLTGIVSKTKSVVIFINQMRQKIGVMYGPTETTTGGTALKYYASLRLDVRKIETLEKESALKVHCLILHVILTLSRNQGHGLTMVLIRLGKEGKKQLSF